MRFAGFVGFFRVALTMAALGCAAGCAARRPAASNAGSSAAGPQVSGVWDAVTSATIDEGMAAGDVRIEKQEWHLSQSGSAIRGYYIAALTYVSGDGRPYVCSRQPQFSALQRFEVAGHVQAGAIEIQELGQAENPKENRCDPGMRQLARYRGLLDGDVLTLVSGRQQTRLYRIHATTPGDRLVAEVAPQRSAAQDRSIDGPAMSIVRPPCRASRTRTSAGWGSGSIRAAARGAIRSRSARSGTSTRPARRSPATTIASSTRCRPTATRTAAAWRSSSRSRRATSSAA